MKIAVTSQNFKTVTNHAGKARRFIVFSIDETGTPVEVDRLDLPKDMSLHNVGHSGAPHPIDEMDVILSASFGVGFARRMAGRTIVASLTAETDPVAAVRDFLAHGQRLPAGGCGEHDHEHKHKHDHHHHGDHACGCSH